MTKRQGLLGATIALVIVGLALASLPFLASLSPPDHLGPPFLDVSLSEITPGSYKLVKWAGKPVAVFRTSPVILAALRKGTARTL